MFFWNIYFFFFGFNLGNIKIVLYKKIEVFIFDLFFFPVVNDNNIKKLVLSFYTLNKFIKKEKFPEVEVLILQSY